MKGALNKGVVNCFFLVFSHCSPVYTQAYRNTMGNMHATLLQYSPEH